MESRDKSNPQLLQSSPESRMISRGARPKTAGGSGPIRYYCSFRNTIDDVLSARGWIEVEEGDEFDFVWADREWIYSAFDRMHLESWQRLNHFRNGRELCRKDLMAKNMKKRRRALEKENRREEAQLYDFIPTTVVIYLSIFCVYRTNNLPFFPNQISLFYQGSTRCLLKNSRKLRFEADLQCLKKIYLTYCVRRASGL